MRIPAGLLVLLAGCSGYEFGGPIGRPSDRFFESFHEDPRRQTTVRGPGGGSAGNVWIELDVIEEGESESDRVGVLWSLTTDIDDTSGSTAAGAEKQEAGAGGSPSTRYARPGQGGQEAGFAGAGGGGLRRNGVRVAEVRADTQAEFRARADRAQWSRRIQAGLLVAPGRSGVLRCGETVPLTEPVTVILTGGTVRSIAWREVGLEWSVVAEIAENRRLRLVLAPRLADAQGASADFQELAVAVTLDEGQSVVFGLAESAEAGGGRRERVGIGGVLFGASTVTARRRRAMVVTPWIR